MASPSPCEKRPRPTAVSPGHQRQLDEDEPLATEVPDNVDAILVRQEIQEMAKEIDDKDDELFDMSTRPTSAETQESAMESIRAEEANILATARSDSATMQRQATVINLDSKM